MPARGGAFPAVARASAGRRRTSASANAAEAHVVSTPCFREAVTLELFRLLARGEPTIETVARALAITPKSLARQLAEEGTTFGEALADLRRRLAVRYVEGTTLGVDQIAMLLGYGRVASFRRAFRRWTGASPSAARRARGATTA